MMGKQKAGAYVAPWKSKETPVAKRKTPPVTKVKTPPVVEEQELPIPVGVADKKKVAIVGFAPSSKDKAPFEDKAFEIWGCNELYMVVPRVDVLFEVHGEQFLQTKKRNIGHLEWLRKSPIPVYMQEHYADIPASVPYPKDLMMKEFGGYFTNSISWMLALAIHFRFDEIHVYGVDMATAEEYAPQRPSVEYFLGIAHGIHMATGKCKVFIPSECDLLKTFYLYGYEDDKATAMTLKMRAREQELQGRMNAYRGQAEQAIAAMNQMAGALDDTQYWGRNYQYIDTGKIEKETT